MRDVEVAPAPSAADGRDFAALYQAQRDRALRLAFLLCGDVHRAEEAVADAFARVYPHWRQGRVDDPERYLRRAVVNELRNRRRHRWVERREEARHRVPPRGALPEDAVLERDRLLAALAQLPPRQRAAVVLRFYEDLSEADTAATLGVAVGSVKSSVSRGLARLRDLLGER